MIFNLQGDAIQNSIVRDGISMCTFPFERLQAGLLKEGKVSIRVEWADLSRYNERAAVRAHGDSHVEEDGAKAHPIEREVEGRMRVLGLYYLPPHTKIVLDKWMVNDPALAREVFLAEVAHAVDYCYMTAKMRRDITNLLHTEQLPPDADVRDGVWFHLDGHDCSWFDKGPYAMWVGEAFMEAFYEAFTTLEATMNLFHTTNAAQAVAVRRIVLGTPDEPPLNEPEPPSEPVPAPEPEPAPQPKPEPLCGFKKSKVVHKPTCWVARFTPSSCKVKFANYADAVAVGRRGCKFCKPNA